VPRHRFDPVALVFGIVFVAAGAIVLAGGELIDEGRALVPAGLIALGVAVLVHVGRRPRSSAPAGTAPEPTLGVVGDKDLDSLFAPVDHALADWDRAHAGEDTTGAGGAATDTMSTEAKDVYDTRIGVTGAADPTEVDIAGADDTAADITEVVDPTERYPRSEPE
jgi:hypothetical protein